MKKDKQGILFLAILVGAALWYGRKKTKAGDPIFDLDEGEFVNAQNPSTTETVVSVSTDLNGNQNTKPIFVGPFMVEYGQSIAGKKKNIGSCYTN